jgi:hypothetical protein
LPDLRLPELLDVVAAQDRQAQSAVERAARREPAALPLPDAAGEKPDIGLSGA